MMLAVVGVTATLGRLGLSEVHKIDVPAGEWIVETLTGYCQSRKLGRAEVTGIGLVSDVWVLLDREGRRVVRNFSDASVYEMTSLVGNVTLRRGRPVFDRSCLAGGAYPRWDTRVRSYNCHVHTHVTFAETGPSIVGGHLLDARVCAGAELVVRGMTGTAFVPREIAGRFPDECVTDMRVSSLPHGTTSDWDVGAWYSAD